MKFTYHFYHIKYLKEVELLLKFLYEILLILANTFENKNYLKRVTFVLMKLMRMVFVNHKFLDHLKFY